MSEDERSKEEQILEAVRVVLVNVAKDTATQPGMKHPLSDSTVNGIRDCLQLVSQRQRELAEAAGRPMTDRPRMPGDDAPGAGEEVVVPFPPRREGGDEE